MFPFFSSNPSGNHPDRFQGLLPVVCLAGGLALLAWNWAFALALIMGAGVTVLLYRVQLSPWQVWMSGWQNQLQAFGNSPQRVLIVSLLGGGLTWGGTYLTTEIWKELHSFWIATGFALEGLGLLFLLVLSVFQRGYGASHDDDAIDQILGALRHSDPLHRLQGIYRADRLGQRSGLTEEQFQLLINGLALLTQQEAIVEVRNMALDTLDRFHDDPYL